VNANTAKRWIDVDGINIRNSSSNPLHELEIDGYIQRPTVATRFTNADVTLSATVSENWDNGNVSDSANTMYYIWAFFSKDGSVTLKYSGEKYDPLNPQNTVYRKRVGRVYNDGNSNFKTVAINNGKEVNSIYLYGPNGGEHCGQDWHASRRFKDIYEDIGGAMILHQQAAYVEIRESGVYSIYYNDSWSGNNIWYGIARNSSSCGGAYSQSGENTLALSYVGGEVASISTTVYLKAGETIRALFDNKPYENQPQYTTFKIVKLD